MVITSSYIHTLVSRLLQFNVVVQLVRYQAISFQSVGMHFEIHIKCTLVNRFVELCVLSSCIRWLPPMLFADMEKLCFSLDAKTSRR